MNVISQRLPPPYLVRKIRLTRCHMNRRHDVPRRNQTRRYFPQSRGSLLEISFILHLSKPDLLPRSVQSIRRRRTLLQEGTSTSGVSVSLSSRLAHLERVGPREISSDSQRGSCTVSLHLCRMSAVRGRLGARETLRERHTAHDSEVSLPPTDKACRDSAHLYAPPVEPHFPAYMLLP